MTAFGAGAPGDIQKRWSVDSKTNTVTVVALMREVCYECGMMVDRIMINDTADRNHR